MKTTLLALVLSVMLFTGAAKADPDAALDECITEQTAIMMEHMTFPMLSSMCVIKCSPQLKEYFMNRKDYEERRITPQLKRNEVNDRLGELLRTSLYKTLRYIQGKTDV